MAQSPKSERELLISRVQKQRLADSLSKNLEQLCKTQERLSTSRLSSASSSSLHSLRRAYSTMQISKKSDSRQKMLKEIIQKLKNSRKIITETPVRSIQSSQKGENLSSSKRESRNRVNKLEEMMKDIKKCNQMSTKAVYSIKKSINEELVTANHTKNAGSNHQASNGVKNSSIVVLINELASVKEELNKIKQENLELRNIITESREERDRQRSCQLCNCACHLSKK